MSRREEDFREWARVLDVHEQSRAGIESDPAWLERDQAEADVLAEEARLRAQSDANVEFARARQCLNMGYWLVAVDADGQLLEGFPASRDEQAAAAWWSMHPDSIAAMATGPDTGLYCLDVGHPKGGGPAWLVQACYEPPPPGYEPDPEDAQPRPPGWPRDPLGAPINMFEAQPHSQPRLRATRVAVGSRAIREAAQRLLRPLQPPVRQLLVWEYPQGWKLPKAGTRITSEITVLGFVPLAGSVIKLGGRSWQVTNDLGRIQPAPPYLCEVLAGKRTPAPLPPQLRPARVEMA